MDPNKLLAEVRKRMEALQYGVFHYPPATQEEFRHMLGRWLGLNEIAAIIQAVLDQEAAEEAQDKDD